ncbi:MAG: TMEM175 family protein [Anaerovoracaceae bacterium]|jgi:uncharacterized membrane protein
MSKTRLEAMSDGILAIIITISVLELSAPEGNTWADLSANLHTLWAYLVGYIYIAIYWVNHHRLIASAAKISGRTLWANFLWLFFVSLIPFVTSWISKAGFEGAPVMSYSGILLLSAVTYHILALSIARANGRKTNLFKLIGGDRRSLITIIGYTAAIPLSYYFAIVPFILYIAIAIYWIIPDVETDRAA